MLKGESLDRFIDAFWGDGDGDASFGEMENAPSAEFGDNAPRDAGQGRAQSAKESALEEFGPAQDGLLVRPVHKERVGRRTRAAGILMLLFVPLILYLSVKIFHGQKYLLVSLLVVFFAMAPFFLVFEGRKPQAREIMVIAVLAALGVAGRAAFFMAPNFKPVAAIVIIAGVSLGGEAGFLVGCMIIMVSNMFMGQGPWTPWQMFAYGVIGFLAGALSRKGVLKAKKLPLCVYGFLSVFFLFGGIMNPASLLMSYGRITKSSLLAIYISGAPMDLVQAVSTVIFLWALGRPMLEKLERVKLKYGLIQRESGR